MFIIRLLVLLTLFSASVTHAGQVTQSGLKVTKIMTGYPGGEAFFLVDKAPFNPKGCAGTTATYHVLAVDPSKSDVDQVLSTLLTAFSSGKNIEVQIYDDVCFKGHAVIRRVAIY